MNDAILSDLSQRVGWTLVHSVWQFALLAMVLGIGLLRLQSSTPHLRHGFLLVVLCLMALVPLATFSAVESTVASTDESVATVSSDTKPSVAPHRNSIEAAGREPHGAVLVLDSTEGSRRSADLATGPRAIENTFRNFTATAQRLIRKWMNVILAVWMCGMLVVAIRPLVSWRATRRLRNRGRSLVPVQIKNATARVAERLRIRQAIEVTQSTLVDVPTVIGWLKPLVLLPASAISGLTPEQLDAVIAHELAHVRRQDYLVNLFQLLMETVFFYHPAVWWISHLMRVEREACCDDIAIHMTGDRVGYAKLLLWLEVSRNQSTPATLGISSSGGSLLARIRRIVYGPTQATGIGPVAFVASVVFMISIGCFLAISSNATSAQETAKSGAAPRNIATLRNLMSRTIEFEDWSRLMGLAKLMAEEGEYEEAIEWLSKAPLGERKDGKLDPAFYYKVITEICEDALKHDRLDFVESVLDQLVNPERQTPISKQFPPKVFDVAIAILEFHLSKGDIGAAIDYLNSHPNSSHLSMVRRAVAKAAHNGHGDQVEAFSKKLTDPKVRFVCEREVANSYYWRSVPDKIWRLADQMAMDHPDDLIAEVNIRDSAMRSYARMAPERFVELVPICRERIAKLPDAEPNPLWNSSQPTLSREQMARLADADRVRYMGDLALFAAYAKHYALCVELSAKIPMLTTSGSATMDLSGSDRHPVLYAITELQKQHEFDQALAIIATVNNDAVALASLARLANLTGFSDDLADHQESYQRIVDQLTMSYQEFAERNDEATVRDTYDGLPESLHIHLQRISNATLSPDDVPYLDRGRLLKTGEYFDLLLKQGKIDEIVQHIESLLKAGNLNGSKWIVTKLAEAGEAKAFDRLRDQIKQAIDVQRSDTSKSTDPIWDYRKFLDQSALSAYIAGQRDLSYDTFMKLDRSWMSPSMVSQVAYKAWKSGDMEFLRRMESSASPLMREAALARLAIIHVLAGDIKAAKEAVETFEREFGEKNRSWSIYRMITDEREVKDPIKLLAATQFALQKVPFESNDYSIIALECAKLLGQLYPDKPLPVDWLEQLSRNPKLKYQVELAHTHSVWEKTRQGEAVN